MRHNDLIYVFNSIWRFVVAFFFFTNFTEIMALQQGGLHVARATNMWKLRINENS